MKTVFRHLDIFSFMETGFLFSVSTIISAGVFVRKKLKSQNQFPFFSKMLQRNASFPEKLLIFPLQESFYTQ